MCNVQLQIVHNSYKKIDVFMLLMLRMFISFFVKTWLISF